MLPSLAPGERLIVAPTWLVPPRRGAVVVVPDPREPHRHTVKRVVGLPGETVELRDGRLLLDGVAHDEPYATPDDGDARWDVGAGQLVVLGDHRVASTDSRTFGPVAAGDVVATVVAGARPRRWLPPAPPVPRPAVGIPPTA